MGKLRIIYFRNRKFHGYRDLIDYWNKDRPEFVQAKPRNVASNVQKWEKKHPGKTIPDQVIERLLTTRTSRNTISYKNHYFSGPTAVYNTLAIQPDIGFKGFHRNLQRWRKNHTDEELTDEIIESFSLSQYVKSDEGTWVGETRREWQKLPKPKLLWGRVSQKICEFRSVFGRPPNPEEIAELALPEEWMISDPRYTNKNRRQLTREEFYGLFDIEKVTLGTWSARVTKFKNRNGRISARDAISLMNIWGSLDKSKGLLYKWTNKINGKKYVGITTETLEERIRGHLRQVERGDSPPNGLHTAIAKYGFDAFEIKTIGEYEDIEELAFEERRQIKLNNSIAPNGYNLDVGGKGVSIRALPLRFRDKKYKNLTALAHNYNIPVKRLESRLRLGWNLSDAIDLPRGLHKDKPFARMADKPISILAKEHGLNPQKVYERISNYGWSLEEALDIKSRIGRGGRAKIVVVSGQEFPSHREAAKHFGIPEGTWRKRVTLGWSLEQVAGLEEPPVRDNRRLTGLEIIVDGKTFNSISTAARYFDLKDDTFRARLQRGWAPEQAAGILPPPN